MFIPPYFQDTLILCVFRNVRLHWSALEIKRKKQKHIKDYSPVWKSPHRVNTWTHKSNHNCWLVTSLLFFFCFCGLARTVTFSHWNPIMGTFKTQCEQPNQKKTEPSIPIWTEHYRGSVNEAVLCSFQPADHMRSCHARGSCTLCSPSSQVAREKTYHGCSTINTIDQNQTDKNCWHKQTKQTGMFPPHKGRVQLGITGLTHLRTLHFSVFARPSTFPSTPQNGHLTDSERSLCHHSLSGVLASIS